MKQCPKCNVELRSIAHREDKYGCPDCPRNWNLIDSKELAKLKADLNRMGEQNDKECDRVFGLETELAEAKHALGMHKDALKVATNELRRIRGLADDEIKVCRKGIEALILEQVAIDRALVIAETLTKPEEVKP